MVRSVTTFDEDFTEDDMAAALDWQAEDNARCSCGLPLDETTRPDREDTYDVQLLRCHACAAREGAVRAHAEGGGSTAGLKSLVRDAD